MILGYGVGVASRWCYRAASRFGGEARNFYAEARVDPRIDEHPCCKASSGAKKATRGKRGGKAGGVRNNFFLGRK